MPNVMTPVEQIGRMQRELEAARRISQTLFQHRELNEIIEKALTVALDVVDAEAGSVLLADPKTQQLVFHYSIGQSPVAPGTAIPWHQGIAGAVFKSGEPEVISNMKGDARHCGQIDALTGLVTQDLIALPLKQWEGDPVGVLEILNKRNGRLNEEDLGILIVIAAFTALAMEQSRRFQEAKLAEIARLLGDIGHDIKNMLTPVIMGAGLVKDELDELFTALPNLDSVQSARERCGTVTGLLRNSSRQIQDRVKQIADCVKGVTAPPKFTKCRVAAVVDSVVSVLQLVAQENGIVIKTDGLDALPEIRADESRLYNAFYNLVNNAIAEVPRGGSITVQGSADLDAGVVHVSVVDTGRGMPPDVRDSLFTSAAISRKPGGTGLGTKIVKDMIEMHGGKVTVESEEGVGSSFQLRLPIRAAVPHRATG